MNSSLESSTRYQVRGTILAILTSLTLVIVMWRILWIQNNEEFNMVTRQDKAGESTLNTKSGTSFYEIKRLPFFHLYFDPLVPSEQLFVEGIDSLSIRLSQFFGTKPPNDYRLLITKARAEEKRYLKLGNKYLDEFDAETIKTWPIFRKGRFAGGLILDRAPFDDHWFYPFGSMNRNLIENTALMKTTAIGPNLTLDIRSQLLSKKELTKHLSSSQAEFGALIITEIQSGEILAMVNLDQIANEQYYELRNHMDNYFEGPDDGLMGLAASSEARTKSIWAKTKERALLQDSTDAIDTKMSAYEICWMYHALISGVDAPLHLLSGEIALKTDFNLFHQRPFDKSTRNVLRKHLEDQSKELHTKSSIGTIQVSQYSERSNVGIVFYPKSDPKISCFIITDNNPNPMETLIFASKLLFDVDSLRINQRMATQDLF